MRASGVFSTGWSEHAAGWLALGTFDISYFCTAEMNGEMKSMILIYNSGLFRTVPRSEE